MLSKNGITLPPALCRVFVPILDALHAGAVLKFTADPFRQLNWECGHQSYSALTKLSDTGRGVRRAAELLNQGREDTASDDFFASSLPSFDAPLATSFAIIGRVAR